MHGVRNVSFLENFAFLVNERSPAAISQKLSPPSFTMPQKRFRKSPGNVEMVLLLRKFSFIFQIQQWDTSVKSV